MSQCVRALTPPQAQEAQKRAAVCALQLPGRQCDSGIHFHSSKSVERISIECVGAKVKREHVGAYHDCNKGGDELTNGSDDQ
jgi:hypothetical protein